jgi:hypothetical protein
MHFVDKSFLSMESVARQNYDLLQHYAHIYSAAILIDPSKTTVWPDIEEKA